MSPSKSHPSRIGPFHVVRELGRGSNGAVYLARRDGVGDPCALKLLLHADSEGQARFDLEAAITGRLLHPLIVGAFESGTHERFKWIAMEYVDGENLQDRLVRGPLEPQAARRLFADMAEALDFAHQRGVVHRDLKPANILIDREGTAKLTDFGLARTLNSNLTRAGDMIGTPYYMAPEQFEDPTGVDARADVYALGVMLYEALSGRRPFEGKTIPVVTRAKRLGVYEPLSKVAPQVPSDLVEICEQAMAHAPADRTASARDLCQALRQERAAPASGSSLATLVVGAALAVALLVLTLTYARWRGLARDEGAKQALVDGRAALTAGDLAAARQALDQVEASGLQTLRADAQPELTLLHASERLNAGDPGPARELLDSAAPAGLEEPHSQLERALVVHEASSLGGAAAVEPGWLLELGDRLLGLRDQPGLPHAREALATRALAMARRLSREREPYQVPLDLLRLAERATEGELARQARLERASYLFRRGRFEEAGQVAGSLLRLPGRLGYQARYVAAFGQLWQDRYEAGLKGLRAIWEDDPEGVVGLNAGAVFNSYSGRNDVGEALALRSLELDPEYVDAWISLTFCRSDLLHALRQANRPAEGERKLEQALESSDQALRLQRDHPRAWMARAFVSGNMGRSDDSLEAYSTLIDLTEPRPFARGLRFRAKLWLQRGDAPAALRDYTRALDRDPGDVEALAWRGLVHDHLGDARAAERDWQAALLEDKRAFEAQVGRFPPEAIARVEAVFSRGRSR